MNSDQSILEQQIYALNQRIDQLNQRVLSLEKANGLTLAARSEVQEIPVGSQAGEQENLLELDSSSLLKNISFLCFVLVAALGLRSLADNQILEPHLGATFGIFYAAGIIGGGHFLYRRASSLGPIFSTTGALLMFSILVETHERFSSMPDVIVYDILAATGIGLAIISYRHNVALPAIVGTLGMCLAAVTIDYPAPYFPSLILILWVANILAFFATRIKRCSWLRWILLILTHAVLQTWGLKISGVTTGRNFDPESLAPDLFIPMVILIGVTYTLIALLGIVRSGNQKVSKFDFSLPSVNAAWCYVASIYALKNPTLFCAPAAVAAVAYFALAYWLSTRETSNSQGTNTFVAGGLILACLSLPGLLSSFIYPLPLLALLAFTCGHYSVKWNSGGIRLSGYVLQIYIAVLLALAMAGYLAVPQLGFTLIALICGIIALFQFRFSRDNSPPATSLFFGKYDPKDKSALICIFAGLTDLFFFIHGATGALLTGLEPSKTLLVQACTESAIINLAALVLVTLAFFKRNQEMRNIAIIILAVGGAKVFLFDLFNISGAWLVISILSVGIAAAYTSVILTRWSGKTAPSKEKSGEQKVTGIPTAGDHKLPVEEMQ